jgi:hypothetical protein
MKLKTIKYKGWEIIIDVSGEGLFCGYVPGIGRAIGPLGVNMEWATLSEAESAAIVMVDTFLSARAATWEELAKAIHATLVWTSHEDCEIDPQILKQLVTSFAKGRTL